MHQRDQSKVTLGALLAALLTVLQTADQVSAHPPDQLTQHPFVELRPAEIRLTTAIGGGLLANEMVLSNLDSDGDRTATPLEQRAWL